MLKRSPSKMRGPSPLQRDPQPALTNRWHRMKSGKPSRRGLRGRH